MSCRISTTRRQELIKHFEQSGEDGLNKKNDNISVLDDYQITYFPSNSDG